MDTLNTVEYNLTASRFNWSLSDGRTIEAWGFNNQLPGPALKAKKGDKLVVKVKNELSEPTIIHWHGIRLPAAMDGTGEVQKPVMPGEEFVYSFVVPDAGTFWYHSHHNETIQMERGMYGALIVQDDNDPAFDDDRVFLLDDMKLTRDNNFTVPGNALARLKERHDGREGNVCLVNGKESPEITINAGQTERWRFVNTSNARYIRLQLGGKTFKIIGNDGGLLQRSYEADEVLLTPGERVDIAVGPFAEGEHFTIDALPYDRMTFLKAKRRQYATVKVIEAKQSIAHVPTRLRKIDPLTSPNAPAMRRVKLSVGPSMKTGLSFKVNGGVHVQDQPVYLGELQVWEVDNASLMDHPFHLHGFFFQVLEENGKANTEISWKDTYNLKPRTKIKIAWMPDRPGKWMYHCHIVEHHAAGMMANFEVIEKGQTYIHSAHAHSCA